MVQILHGLAEHAGRYASFAGELAERGFHVFAHDHRGHGDTKAADAPLGVFATRDGWETMLADVAAVNDHIRQAHPEVPLLVFGHSMGSIVGFNFIGRHPEAAKGAALWNAGLDAGGLARIGRFLLSMEAMMFGRGAASRLAPKLTFEPWNKAFKPNRTDFDWLSRDESQVDRYAEDPLCGFAFSTGMMLDLLSGVFFGADMAHFDGLARDFPLHLVGGSDDPSTQGGKLVQQIAGRFQGAGFSDVTCTIFDGMRHESLNEIDREKAVTAFLEWADRVVRDKT